MKGFRIFPATVIATIIALILFLAIGVLAETPTPIPDKPWSDQKTDRITWGDFKGPVPDPVPEDEAAEISTGHDTNWKPGDTATITKKPDGTYECTIHFASASSTTVMDPNQSWVKEDAKTDELLNHEKGHFDLAEKFRREKLQPQLDDGKPPPSPPEEKKDLVCNNYTGTGATAQAACDDATAKAQAAFDKVVDEKDKLHGKAQDDYDNDTEHGTNEEKQKEWKDKINKQLGLKDEDKDSIPDIDDNCPKDPNQAQLDENHDGVGDLCRVDTDVDGVPDTEENRFGSDPSDPASTPEDLGWEIGFCTDGLDNDKDGHVDIGDSGCQDFDLDSVSDAIDTCYSISNPEQMDTDSDGLGDACDPDDDNDGIPDELDNCLIDFNWDQKDQDLNGIGNACDWDLDGDGWTQFCVAGFCVLSFDNCPFIANPDKTDSDGDGIGDACEPMFVSTPNGGEVIPSGSIYPIKWIASPEAVKFKLHYSKDNGTTWILIAKNVTGTSYDWKVPRPIANKKKCRVKVRAFNSEGVMIGKDISDGTFTIEVVRVIQPNGGEIWKSGTTQTITWQTNEPAKPVAKSRLRATMDGGATWYTIKTLLGNPGSYHWTVHSVITTKNKCKVKVILLDSLGNSLGKDASDGYFTIQPQN